MAEPGERGERAEAVAAEMDAVFNGLPAKERTVEAVTAHLARQLARQVAPEALPEIVLAMDERAVEAGPRTRRQARMLEVIADFAGLRFTAEEPAAAPAPSEAVEAPAGATEEPAQPAPAPSPTPSRTEAPAEPAAPDINAADAETLASLPGIGPARARDIIAHRPFTSVDELESISGIGPATVAKLREAGVQCE